VKKLAGLAVALGAVGIAVTFLLWMLPSEEFIFTPSRAKPLADRVEVEGARPARGHVYYTDVFVRRTSLLEDLLPFTRPDGSTVVPEHALLPPGITEEARDRQTAAEMERSEKIAAAVALHALGYEPEVRPLGALVSGTFPETPAAGKLEVGDVIVAVDGREVLTPLELQREIGTRRPGEEVRVGLKRDGKELEVSVGTIARPGDPDRPIVGIQVEQQAHVELPIDVEIDLGAVGGPSAGLPFALEIARLLGRDVAHGCRIAATGELALDGSVVPVGGIKQKTIGALRADVDLFLVPAGRNAEDARKHADGLALLPVESYQQALHALRTADLNC
jgi:PDZ domain-containing protein